MKKMGQGKSKSERQKLMMDIQEQEAEICMKKALIDFTMIIELYDSTKGEEGTPEHQDSIEFLKDKYVSFKVEHLETIILDMKKVKLITGQKIEMPAYPIPTCSLSWWLLKVHKFFRYIYVSFYYYLTPFLILVFQAMLLYSNQIYTQYLKNKEAEELAEAAVEAAQSSSTQGGS